MGKHRHLLYDNIKKSLLKCLGISNHIMVTVLIFLRVLIEIHTEVFTEEMARSLETSTE